MSLNDPHWGRGGSDDNEEKKSAPDKENRSDTDRKDERGQNGFENKEAGKRKNEGDDLDRLWDEFNRALGGKRTNLVVKTPLNKSVTKTITLVPLADKILKNN